MTARAEFRDSFAGLTIRDERGASLVIERTADNAKTVVWIAPPGENDGPGVGVSDDDQRHLIVFLARKSEQRGRHDDDVDELEDNARSNAKALIGFANQVSDLKAALRKAEKQCDALRAVADAADDLVVSNSAGLRAFFGATGAALIAAVDALPKAATV